MAIAAHRERLVAYVWPDQADRITRVEAAIALAQEDPPAIEAADAADWVDRVFGGPAESGVVRVLYHSIAFQYFPDEAKRRIASRMEVAGRLSTSETPLAWLAFEQRADKGPHLTLCLWPGGEEIVLAKGDAHGRKVEWLA